VLGDVEGLVLGDVDGLVLGDVDGLVLGEVDGEAAGNGVGEAVVTVDPGVGVGGVPVQTVSLSSIAAVYPSGVVTVGASNVGMDSPPWSIATVPVGETNIMSAFDAFAVVIEHGMLQNVNSGSTVSAAAAQSFCVRIRPRWSKRIVVGNERLAPTI
jgi:hypothetical protein